MITITNIMIPTVYMYIEIKNLEPVDLGLFQQNILFSVVSNETTSSVLEDTVVPPSTKVRENEILKRS